MNVMKKKPPCLKRGGGGGQFAHLIPPISYLAQKPGTESPSRASLLASIGRKQSTPAPPLLCPVPSNQYKHQRCPSLSPVILLPLSALDVGKTSCPSTRRLPVFRSMYTQLVHSSHLTQPMNLLCSCQIRPDSSTRPPPSLGNGSVEDTGRQAFTRA